MAIVDQKRSALPVPFAMEVPDRVPKERYFDPDFYQLEAEQLWPRVWQMACRLEEIPQPGDFVEYEILDQSVIVRAHRRPGGARVPERLPPPRRQGRRRARAPARAGSPARSTAGATAPTARTRASRGADLRRAQPASPATSTSRRCGARSGAGARGSTSTTTRRRCGSASSRSPPSSTRGRSSRCGPSGGTRAGCPVNWKLAEEAFMEQYHVLETHPQLRHPRRGSRRATGDVRPAGVRRRRAPLPAHDERGHGRHGARQRRAHRRGPARHRAARRPRRRRWPTWNRTLNDAVVELAPRPRRRHPRPQRARRRGPQRADGLLLPALLRAADVQQRLVLPVPPARAGGDADGDLVAHPVPGGRGAPSRPTPPEVWERDDPRCRRSRRRTSRTCRASSGACTRGASSTCACPSGLEGHISNFERTIDGFLAGLPYEQLLARAAARST